jgi:DNA-binding MarR family transcriptional regulator
MKKQGARLRETATDALDSLRRIVHALRSSHRAAAGLELTGAQLFVLTTLGASAKPMSVGELAECTRTDQSTVSVVVGRLIKRGLVHRARSAEDTRRVDLTLTARGKGVLRKTPTTVAQRKLADALSDLAASESAELARILKEIVDAMGEADAPARMMFDEASPRKRRRAS